MCAPLKSLAFAAALSVLAGATAHAQTVDLQVRSQTVSYADLDLSQAAGVNTLMARINGAAKNVCGPAPDAREWHTAYQACIQSAVNQAVSEVSRSVEANHLAMNIQRRHGG
jgi:UrcA family protein